MTHSRRHPLIWLALVGMLAVALLPTVSHALAHARGVGAAGWAQVCTPQGLRTVASAAATTDREPAPVQATVNLDHCPLCTLAAEHPGLPPTPARDMLMLAPDAARVPIVSPALRTRTAWVGAQPRAPPTPA